MKLLIDIGNTTIRSALLGKKLRVLPLIDTRKEFYLSGRDIKGVKTCVICSVVPRKTKEAEKFIRSKGINVYVLGRDLRVPLKNNYKQKSNLGQDRILSCWGALHLFPSPLAVVDFGTALTVDYVSRKNCYEGGIIFPGPRISISNLIDNASMLRKIPVKSFNTPKHLIGKTTRDAILSGIFYGYRGVCEYIIGAIKKKEPRLKVVATGGDSRQIAGNWAFIDRIEPDLTLLALKHISQYYGL